MSSFFKIFACGSKKKKKSEYIPSKSKKSSKQNSQTIELKCPDCGRNVLSKSALDIHQQVYCKKLGGPREEKEPQKFAVETSTIKKSTNDDTTPKNKKLNTTASSQVGQSTLTDKNEISKATTGDKTNSTMTRTADTNVSMMHSRADSVASTRTYDGDWAVKFAKDLKKATLEIRRTRELEFIQQYITKHSHLKFVISEDWIDQYTKFLNGEAEQEPGEINNRLIQQKIQNKTFTQNIYAVHPQIWGFLIKMYGGGPEIQQNLRSFSITSQDSDKSTAETKTTDINRGDPYENSPMVDQEFEQMSRSQPLSSLTLKPIGFHNSMFYCYMNSALQCLMGVDTLVQYTYEEHYKKDLSVKATKFWKAFDEVVTNHTKKSSVLIPKMMRRIAQNFFDPDEQHDSHEFLRYLLSGMQDEINPKKKGKAIEFKDPESAWKHYMKLNPSVVDSLFAGQIQNKITCKVCNHVTTTYDPFLDLSLPILPGKTRHLDECLQVFLKEEEIRDSYTCDKCKKKKKVLMKSSITKYPDFLFIHLKRFQTFPRKKKIEDDIEYPVDTMKLKNYYTQQNIIYGLKGIVIHVGGVNSGHYVAFSKRGDDWYLCNDESIKRANIRDISNKEAYLLMYERLA